jgi:hypothetical protein
MAITPAVRAPPSSGGIVGEDDRDPWRRPSDDQNGQAQPPRPPRQRLIQGAADGQPEQIDRHQPGVTPPPGRQLFIARAQHR